MSLRENIKTWMRSFSWESEDQHQGFGALFKCIQSKGPVLHCGSTPQQAQIYELFELVCLISAFFIQKDHESNVWWSSTVGEQTSKLEDQIKLLQIEIQNLKGKIDREVFLPEDQKYHEILRDDVDPNQRGD